MRPVNASGAPRDLHIPTRSHSDRVCVRFDTRMAMQPFFAGYLVVHQARHALCRRALELEPESDEAMDALQKAETLLSKAACLRTLEGHSGQVHDISTIEVS